MGLARKTGAIILLLIGFWSLGRSLETALDRNPNRLGKRETITAGLLIGLPATVGGSWLIADARRRKRLQQERHLRQAFFQVLQLGEGKVTPLQLSMAAGLAGEEAKVYLDQRAREFDATFHVEEDGGLVYCFSAGHIESHLLISSVEPLAELRFDVILTAVPDYKKRQITGVVQKLTGLDWKAVKTLVKTVPQPIQEGASLTTAREFKRELEAVGAEVIVALKS